MNQVMSAEAKQVAQWMAADEAVLIDVREVSENQAESIKGAQHIPLAKVEIKVIDAVWEKKWVIHCHSGRRSQMAAEKLLAEGFLGALYNLEGGIVAWKAAELPVRTSRSQGIPLARHVHLLIGSMVLAGLLPLVAGLGLFNVGMAGSCHMAVWLEQYPWAHGRGFRPHGCVWFHLNAAFTGLLFLTCRQLWRRIMPF